MNHRRNHQSASARGIGTQAFAGLGFDLESVREAATMLCINVVTSTQDVECCCVEVMAPGLSGFDLLVALGREIRGR